MYIRSFRDGLPCLLFAPHPLFPPYAREAKKREKARIHVCFYSTVVPGYVLFLPSSLSGKEEAFPPPSCVRSSVCKLPPSLPRQKRKRDREEKYYYYHFYFPLPSVCTATICTVVFAGSSPQSYTLISFYDDDDAS